MGPQAVSETGRGRVDDIRQHGARKLIFVDLNLIADREYAASLFEALTPLGVQWYGLSTVLGLTSQHGSNWPHAPRHDSMMA